MIWQSNSAMNYTNKHGFINVAQIVGESIVDGPGIRSVVFCQGCHHACEGCHNPQSHSFGTGINMLPLQIYSEIKKYKLSKGVTFSGGEPFCQSEPLTELAKMLKNDGYEIACYTGYTFEELLNSKDSGKKQLLYSLDVLIDGPFILKERSLELLFRGSKNQRIIDVQNSIKSASAVLCSAKRWTQK